MDNKKWAPYQEENIGVITSVYESIKKELLELQKETGCPDSFIYEFIKGELLELQKETGCPDSFIYDFIGNIQNEWHPESCHSKVRNKKMDN